MRFVFIDAEKANYPVVVLCRVMQVARSGFYAWKRRSPSKRARADKQLTGQIAQAFAASRGTYGSPRVRVELHASGIVASKRRVTQLMRRKACTRYASAALSTPPTQSTSSQSLLICSRATSPPRLPIACG